MKLDIPEPDGVTLEEWVAALADAVAPIDVLKDAAVEAAWQSWALSLMYTPEFGAAPNPTDYQDWRAWAQDLITAV